MLGANGQFAVFEVLIGLAVLLFGRRLFWLFVATVGFIAGALAAHLLFRGDSGGVILMFAVAGGVLGALLALLLQRLSIALSGFLAGGYVTVVMLHYHRGWETGSHFWATFLIGGILGALVLSMIFDPALIFLSSLTGAALIVQPFRLSPLRAGLVFVLLAAAGIAAQTVLFRRARRRPR